MRNDSSYIFSNTRFSRPIFISVLSCLFILHLNSVIAQDSSSQSSGKAGKLSFTMNMSSFVVNGIRTVKVKLSRKENRKTIVVDNVKTPFNLYRDEVKDYDPANGTGLISKANINNEGEGIFVFPANFNQLTSAVHQFTFIAKMDSDPVYENAEEQITISDAKISIDYSGIDSNKIATATLTGWKDSAFVPMLKAELKLGVKRTFNYLPFGEPELTTDEAGKISGEIPPDIPGNANGTLTITARLEEDDTYGNVEVTKVVPWAVLPRVNPQRGRTLWSPGDNAPLLLVISSVTIIVIIWGTILYLVYLLFKIKRLGKNI